MDGYAVRAEDTAGASRAEPKTLRCIEQVFTGQMPRCTLSGRASASRSPPARRCPPAPMPWSSSRKRRSPKDGAFACSRPCTRSRTSDDRAPIFRRDSRCWSRVSCSTRAGGRARRARTHRRRGVREASRGDPLHGQRDCRTRTAAGAGQIYDVNKFTIAAVVAEHGGIPVLLRTAVDTLEDLSRAVDECLAHDVLVFSGGSSVGERDLILDVIAARARCCFTASRSNRASPRRSASSTASRCSGCPAIRRRASRTPTCCSRRRCGRWRDCLPASTSEVAVPLGQRVISAPGRHQFYTVRIEDGVAMPAFKASGDITSMSRADGYIEIPLAD